MAPKKKKGKRTPAEETNPADAILQHKTKQIITDNRCSVSRGDLNSDDDDDSSGDLINNAHNAPNNSSSIEDVCLHCQSQSLQVQVRCDECSAYICSHCHWCHEFQANHEIRVCDRCDAFYCRACDEMDQCDDCGEVVCGTCSTLLSCKFCGGGLCEECATACGRCGIVLCSRDAKFAVDCDTCRLSYCLVCLASGNKDTCVRCGHRPSKRMEQLVHLRLKSIYKAFKSSTTAATNSASNESLNAANSSNGVHNVHHSVDGSSNYGPHPAKSGQKKYSSSHHGRPTNGTTSSNSARLRPTDESSHNTPCVDDLTPSALMLAAAASAAAPSSQLAAAAAAAAASVVPNAELATAAHAAAGFMAHGNSVSGRCVPNSSSLGNAPSSSGNEPRLNARVSAESYEAERIKAEKAAAELLAELDEEEQAVKSKMSKKKKKKQRQQAKRAAEQQRKNETDQENSPEDEASPFPTETEESPISTKKEIEKPNYNHVENTTATTTTTTTTFVTSKDDAATEKNEETDPLELECEDLIENEDEEGLKRLQSSIKGVPGKAMLRKNVKKALKRLRAANEETSKVNTETKLQTQHGHELGVTSKSAQSIRPVSPTLPAQATSEPYTPKNNNTSNREAQTGTVTPPPMPPRVSDLLQIVSYSHNKVSSNSRLLKGNPGTPKSECIMQMAPLIVGWVIGKGGQRIRDLMEESGARVWIDQESMGPQDPRTVYVSGQRSNVDSAVRMITDLIAKAPTETPNSKQGSTPGAPSVASNCENMDALQVGTPNLSKVPGLPVSIGASENSAFRLKPRERKKVSEGKVWREMTCDPRFVPLLIGKRGWTIKNIQDSSGARVDIDQNVSPRKIIISGNESAVEIAVQMVSDVLSYPQTMLHGATEDLDGFPSSEHILGSSEEMDPLFRGNSDGLDRISVERPSSPCGMHQTRSHSPPSSLIMTGDGKSTISATSSLSSTPEPSVSNNKPMLPTVGPLLPPAYEAQHAQSLQAPFGCFAPAAPQNQTNLNSVPHETAGLRIDHTQQNVSSPHNGRYIHDNGIVPGNPMRVAPPPPPPLNGVQASFEHHPQPLPFVAGHNSNHNQNLMSQHPQHGFSTGFAPIATTERERPLERSPLPPPHQQQSAGVWASEPTLTGGDNFGLSTGVEFFHSSQGGGSIAQSGHLSQPCVNDIIGLPSSSNMGPSGLALGLDRHQNPPDNGVKDDSNIVDSLFGTDPRNDAALVSGLRGLSLEPPIVAASADPWAENAARFDLPPVGAGSIPVPALGQPLHNPAPVIDRSLFSTTTAPDGRQHSRFSWGESD